MKDDGPSKSKGRKPRGGRAKAAGNSGTRVEGDVHVAPGAVCQFAGAGGENKVEIYSGRFAPGQVQAAYAEYLSATCDVVWQPGNPDTGHELLDVYADLRATRRDDHGRMESALPVLELATGADRLVLLGAPGGGKSTFLRYLALKWALSVSSKREQLPAALEGFVPVWIELRALKLNKVPRSLNLPSILEAHLDALSGLQEHVWGEMDWKSVRSFLTRAMDDGKLLFLLDGLDEVTGFDDGLQSNQRIVGLPGMHAAITDLMKWCRASPDDGTRRHRLIITCRELSWDGAWKIEGWHEKHGGAIAKLDLLDDKQRRGFLSAWFGSKSIASAIADHLTHPDRDWGMRLSQMASVPLNLTMIAWLVEARWVKSGLTAKDFDGKKLLDPLPATRAAIYEQVVYGILWEIDDQKALNKNGDNTLSALVRDNGQSRERFVQALASVAFESLNAGGEAGLRYGLLIERLGRGLFGKYVRTGVVADILETMQCRSGILRLENPGNSKRSQDPVYGFVHRSFWEYLAALYIIQGPIQQAVGDDETPPADAQVEDLGARVSHLLDRRLAWGSHNSGDQALEMASEPLRLAAGYFGVEPKDQRPLLVGGANRSGEAIRLMIYSLLERRPRRLGELMLARDLALQSGLKHERCPRSLLDGLVAAMQSSDLTEPARAEVGRALGELGDPRPGVAPRNPPGKGELFFSWSDELEPVPFAMGGDPHARNGGHFVQKTIQRPYRIARYPVTNAQYACFEDSLYFDQNGSKKGWRKRGRPDARFLSPNQPVVNVDWYHAIGFCEWVNELGLSAEELGLPKLCGWDRWTVCLPSEAEWEYAARGREGRWLPWLSRSERNNQAPEAGRQSLQGHCNWAGSQVKATSPVGMYPHGASLCRAEDMMGNVWEWTRTPWRNVPEPSEDLDMAEANGEGTCVLRGGAWDYDAPENLRCAARHGSNPKGSYDFLGFRVAVICLAASGV